MLAIAVNALYTALRKRGTTRQLASAIVACVLSALLLLPAFVWYNGRFSIEQGALSLVEVTAVLVYVVLWGWLVPLGVTTSYCLFTLPRDSNTSVRIPRHHKRTTRSNTTAGSVVPPRRQPGVPVPFVFGEDTPWGWLEHRAGRFQGQRLALKRSIVTIGREEDNDIWLDDETASRYHAELAWGQGQVYLTDCNSLNGVLLNGRRIRGSLLIKAGDLLEIGSHRFLFENAEPSAALNEQDDPLLHHVRRSSVDLLGEISDHVETPPHQGSVSEEAQERGAFTRVPAAASALPTKPLDQGVSSNGNGFTSDQQADRFPGVQAAGNAVVPGGFEAWQDTVAMDPANSRSQPGDPNSVLVICNGELEGRSFLLDRPVLTVGRGSESEIVISDASISRRHAQFLRQANGDYVQDLASRNGTKVNDEALTAPRLLHKGDSICLGSICLEYTFVPEAHTTPLPPLPTPPLARPSSGPVPLRLPSKPK